MDAREFQALTDELTDTMQVPGIPGHVWTRLAVLLGDEEATYVDGHVETKGAFNGRILAVTSTRVIVVDIINHDFYASTAPVGAAVRARAYPRRLVLAEVGDEDSAWAWPEDGTVFCVPARGRVSLTFDGAGTFELPMTYPANKLGRAVLNTALQDLLRMPSQV
jgi:hypothetical protein